MRRRVASFTPAPAVMFAALAHCMALAVAPDARATDCSGIDSPCINSDILWPHAGPTRFVSIGSTDTVAPGQLGFGLLTSYLSRPIVLHSPSPGPGGSDQYAVDDQVNGTFLWAYGVTRRLELDLAVPLTFIQSGAGLSPITGGDGLKDTAVRDMRFGLTYALVSHARVDPDAGDGSYGPFGLAARLEVSAPTGDDDQLAGEGTGVYVPSVAADWRHDRVFVGAEVGARIRPTNELQGARIGTEIVTALGVGYDILPRELLTGVLEAWVLPDLAEQHTVTMPVGGPVTLSTPNGQTIAPAEWQLSARTAPLPGGDFAIQLGGGGELPITNGAVTTPRFRFTLGLRWAPVGRPRAVPAALATTPAAAAAPVVDLHVAGARDVCTSEPDLVDGFRDTDGCSDQDTDNDGIPDRLDKCPTLPEDFAGMADGCPEKR